MLAQVQVVLLPEPRLTIISLDAVRSLFTTPHKVDIDLAQLLLFAIVLHEMLLRLATSSYLTFLPCMDRALTPA